MFKDTNIIITDNKHIILIDVAKFIGIFLVIVGHSIVSLRFNSQKLFTYLWQFIYLFHMPLFFIISGYLYKPNSKSVLYKKIFNCLLKPYYIYQFIYFPFPFFHYLLIEHIDVHTTIIKMLIGVIVGDCYMTNFSFVVCGPCWFILTLAIIKFLMANININLKNLIITLLVSLIILKFLFLLNIDLMFCLDSVLMAIPYFIIGYLFKYLNLNKYINLLFSNKNFSILFVITFVMLSYLILNFILEKNGVIQIVAHINYYMRDKSLTLAYMGGFVGSAAVLLLSTLFKNENKFIKTIGNNTIFIIFFHQFLIFLAGLVKFRNLGKYCVTNYEKIFLLIFLSMIILIINYFVIVLIQKHKNLNFLLGKMSKII